MDNQIQDDLVNAGFDEGQVALLVDAEADEIVQNWPQGRFVEVLGPISGLAAYHVVRQAKTGMVVEVGGVLRKLPETPPYLKLGRNGAPMGHDPSDPSQYWTDPQTGELWRWDGKREQPLAGKKDAANRVIPKQQFPFGKPNRVMQVKHTTVDGVAIPDPVEQSQADLGGYDWFHYGYGVWIGNGGKAYRDVSREVRRRVIDARGRAFGGNPAIVRS